MKKILLLLVFLKLNCSFHNSIPEINPKYLSGQLFLVPEDLKSEILYFSNEVPNVKKIETIEIYFKEVFYIPLIISKVGETEKNLYSLFETEILNAKSKIDLNKNYLIIHKIDLKVKTNYLFEFFINTYFSTYFSYTPWIATAEIGTISKKDFNNIFKETIQNDSLDLSGFTNMIIFKDGRTITNIKTKIFMKTVEVTHRDGKKEIFSKTIVKSIKSLK